MDARPLARTRELIVETTETGVCILDPRSGVQHEMTTADAQVWRAADGELSPSEIAVAAEVTVPAAVATLDRLRAAGLLVAEPAVARRNVLDFAAPVG